MKNLILAVVFVLLMVGAALAVTKTRGASVGVLGAPAAAGTCSMTDKTSACTMKKEQALKEGTCTKGAKQRTCPVTGKPL